MKHCFAVSEGRRNTILFHHSWKKQVDKCTTASELNFVPQHHLLIIQYILTSDYIGYFEK